MPLTRNFKDTIKARVDADPKFRAALLAEAVELLLDGDVDTGRLVLRDYINATIGFEELAGDIGKSSKSLMRMFSLRGNPTANSLFAVVSHLQKATGVHITVAAA